MFKIENVEMKTERSNDLASRCRAYVRWRYATGRQQQTDVPDYETERSATLILDHKEAKWLMNYLQNPRTTREQESDEDSEMRRMFFEELDSALNDDR